MAQMDFFRRAVLAGQNATRLGFGTIRGSVRRNNADGVSTSPYFPSASATQTITVQTETSTYVATLAGNSMAQVLSALNTALGVNGKAFDSDGVVTIQTNTAGGAGWVQVTAGTAAAAVGFDTTLGRNLRASGGDAPSAPEGRVGNGFGTVFLGANENLTADTIQRTQSLLSANLDVLHADLMKEDAIMQKIASFTVDAGAGKFVSFPAGTRLYNGYVSGGSILTRLSVAADLAAFYAIVDSTTRQLTPYKVVGLVTGTVTTDPPYTDATNLADTGKNALGLNLSKFGPVAISAIRDGRVVTCAAAGTNSVVGDIAQIASATNTTAWSNNGMKWVVDQIIDANNIVLRPASQAELTQLGVTLNDTQPVVELNSVLGGGSYGTLQVFTGCFPTGVSIIVRPQLPTGGTYEVWAAQPLSLRARQNWSLPRSRQPHVTNPSPFKSGSDSVVQLQTQRNSASQSADLFEALAENGSTVLSKLASTGALTLAPDGTNTTAATATGTGTGSGVRGVGGATNGAGIDGQGTAAGAGVKGTGGASGAGVAGTGGATGAGVTGTGGATSGDGLTGTATGGNSNGVSGTGQGTGSGLKGTGGASGQGATLAAGGVNSPVKGALNLIPTTNAPSGPDNGDLWITTAGIPGVKLNGSNRTIAVLENAQSFTATQTFSGITLGSTSLYQPGAAALTYGSSGTGVVSGTTAVNNTTYTTIVSYSSGVNTANMTATPGTGAIQVTNAGTYMVTIAGSFNDTNGVGTTIAFRLFRNGTTAMGSPDAAIFLAANNATTHPLSAQGLLVSSASDSFVLQVKDIGGTGYNITWYDLSFTINRVF